MVQFYRNEWRAADQVVRPRSLLRQARFETAKVRMNRQGVVNSLCCSEGEGEGVRILTDYGGREGSESGSGKFMRRKWSKYPLQTDR